MAKTSSRIQKILSAAEAHFGRKVDEVTTPGGEGRSSCRLHFGNVTVIATLRPNYRRAHLEAYALHRLAPHCDDAPKVLGVVDKVIFQSDVGSRRLNMEIARCSQSRRIELAEEAVGGIFRIQAAARAAGLEKEMPHLGVNDEWLDNLTGGLDALNNFSSVPADVVDLEALRQLIATPARQFVKWDCRSGNAAIGDDDKLRWFDFEYSGVRHGAEDLAWLIGDEAWPLRPDVMEDIVRQAFDPATGHTLDAYLDYLAAYTTLHCLQRFRLILKEARKRGWLSKTKVRKFDDAGVHPEFAAHLCGVGAYFAGRNRLTSALVPYFEAAERAFKVMLKNAA
ncbi:hypothetical protein ATO6_14175 [Oceanicola sp. 22II-s10i]|uniref:phosphotransferase n=1 Tax=Oceanicola sp. 22II-s10i TaxID=1317116 RepID=UPI000B52832C|nr:phosphotransferase [Oceanicola sp. 22II-s10i]OWU84194.1 hypothetical protein ATO6_14175 [Oceanicola sp. 22II-s10i]